MIISSSDAQLNLILLPCIEQILETFHSLNKAVLALRTDSESVKCYFDSVMTIFKRIGREKINLVSEAFERADGLDLLESFQRESQNEEISNVCQSIIKEFYEVAGMQTEDDVAASSGNQNNQSAAQNA